MPRNNQHRFQRNETLLRFAATIAVIAGALCLLLSTLLIVNYWQVNLTEPLDHPELVALRARLTGDPEQDADVVDAIRSLDLLARAAFFTSQKMLRTGGLLAVVSGIVFVLALRAALYAAARLPRPSPDAPRKMHWTERARAREWLALLGGVWLLVALIAALFTRYTLTEAPSPGPAPGASESIADDDRIALPDWEEVLRHWPSFRGPGGYGVARFANAPKDWDLETGRNIRWTAEPPLPGTNSPVVWEDRVYVSGADEQRREVYAYDVGSGALLWTTPVGLRPFPSDKTPDVQDYTGWAASTLAAQGDTICAIFATGHLACLDRDGSIRWETHLGVPDNHYGHSSSLILYERLVLVQFDQREGGALYAFDIYTGAEVWKWDRERISWASPVIVGAPEHPALVVVSTRDVDAYDPLSGKLLWKTTCLSGEVGPSPAYGAGMIFVANDYADATAIRPPDPEVEDAEPEQVWQFYESLPDVSSPLATDTFFYLLTSRGEIICLRAQDGETVWVEEFDDAFYASPILVGDLVYALDIEGVMHIFRNADTFESVGSPAFNERSVATPAFLDGFMIARTETRLVCIAE